MRQGGVGWVGGWVGEWGVLPGLGWRCGVWWCGGEGRQQQRRGRVPAHLPAPAAWLRHFWRPTHRPLPSRPGPLPAPACLCTCRLRSVQARRLLCHHTPAAGLDAAPGALLPAHPRQPGLRQRRRRGARPRLHAIHLPGALAHPRSPAQRLAHPAAAAAAAKPQPQPQPTPCARHSARVCSCCWSGSCACAGAGPGSHPGPGPRPRPLPRPFPLHNRASLHVSLGEPPPLWEELWHPQPRCQARRGSRGDIGWCERRRRHRQCPHPAELPLQPPACMPAAACRTTPRHSWLRPRRLRPQSCRPARAWRRRRARRPGSQRQLRRLRWPWRCSYELKPCPGQAQTNEKDCQRTSELREITARAALPPL